MYGKNLNSFKYILDVLERCITTPSDEYRDRMNIIMFNEFINHLLENSSNFNNLTLETIEQLKKDYYICSSIERSREIEMSIEEDKKKFHDSMERRIGNILNKYLALMKLFYYEIDNVREFESIHAKYLKDAIEYIESEIPDDDAKIEKLSIKKNLLTYHKKAKKSSYVKELRNLFEHDFSKIRKDYGYLHKFINAKIEKYSQDYRSVSLNIKITIFH